MKTREKATLLVLIGLLGVTALGIQPISRVRGEEAGDGPLFVDDIGTYFEIANSMYLNMTLSSTEVVHVVLESVPRMVCFSIRSNGSETITNLMFCGFEPNTTYYRYQDGYLIEDLTTDSCGEFAYTQDISEPHHVFIQEGKMTLYIYSDFTFTQNMSEAIVVAANNIVVDGNGYALEGPGYGLGLYLNGRSGVTIKNATVKDWTYGIQLYYSGNNNISGNTISNNYFGIKIDSNWSYAGNLISDNTITNNEYNGIMLMMSIGNDIIGNKISNNVRVGIGVHGCALVSVSDNKISNNDDGIEITYRSLYITVGRNKISENTRGIYLHDCSRNTIVNNTFAVNSDGINLYYSYGNVVYHNKFINNERQALCRAGSNEWDDGYPSGGNYWSDYIGEDANGDGIGDTPYSIEFYQVDRYPLMGSRIAVISTQEEIQIIESWDLDGGVEGSLTHKLEDAINLVDNGNANGAIHKLNDLIKKVTNDAKNLTQEQKDYVIEATQEIIDIIG